MGHTRDLWWTAGDRGPKRKTAKHPDNGGDKSAKRWQAVWKDPDGKTITHACNTKSAAERYWQDQEADIRRGTYVDPHTTKMRVGEWLDTWLAGYSGRPGSVKSAKVHVAQIRREFGTMTLAALADRPSRVKTWIKKLQAEDLTASYIYALHARLHQVLEDAMRDKLIHRNPCSRNTSPPMGKQRPYVITTAQLWQLHDAMPAYLRVSILMGALAGMRVAEASACRPDDLDQAAALWNPELQYPAEPLKSDCSRTTVPVPRSLCTEILAQMVQFPGDWILTDADGNQVGPWRIERAIRTARAKVKGLPEGFRYHDLRHYLASLLISEGHDVKVVQARLRHASAKTTLDTYGHLWPDRDDATRASLEAVFLSRPAPRDSKITEPRPI